MHHRRQTAGTARRGAHPAGTVGSEAKEPQRPDAGFPHERRCLIPMSHHPEGEMFGLVEQAAVINVSRALSMAHIHSFAGKRGVWVSVREMIVHENGALSLSTR